MESQVLDAMEDSQTYIQDSAGAGLMELHSKAMVVRDFKNDVETTLRIEELSWAVPQEVTLHQARATGMVGLGTEQKVKAASDHESSPTSSTSLPVALNPAPNDAPRLRRMRAAEFNCVEGAGVDAEPSPCASAVVQSRKRKAAPE